MKMHKVALFTISAFSIRKENEWRIMNASLESIHYFLGVWNTKLAIMIDYTIFNLEFF